MKKKKTRSKRSRTKYPSLKKELNLKNRQELIDYDYINKLNDEEKAWLDKFTDEYVNASFTKTKGGAYSSKNLHKKASQRREAYQRNNKRNVDTFTATKTTGMLKDAKSLIATLQDKSVRTASEVEDTIITLLDKKNRLKKTKSF